MIQRYFKGAIYIIVIVSLLAGTAATLYDQTTSVSSNTTLPAVERTVFSFSGWVPLVLLIVGVITASWGARGAYRRFRRRRR